MHFPLAMNFETPYFIHSKIVACVEALPPKLQNGHGGGRRAVANKLELLCTRVSAVSELKYFKHYQQCQF